jgi:phosphoribosylaminoimidazole-succinocarboxamide synthase
VRDYLAGTTGTSVLTLYKAGQREMYGLRLPDGLRDNERLPAPILTPTSKEFQGGHDAPLSPAPRRRGSSRRGCSPPRNGRR